jgi:glutaredoxin
VQNARPRKSPLVWIAIVGTLVLCVGIAVVATGRGGSRDAAIRPADMGPVAHAPVAHAPAAAIPDGPMSLADASRVVSIEMYSATWCSSCGRAKTWMREHDIEFHEIDVDQRAGAMAQLQMLNPRRTLPTFDVDGQVLVGFQEPRLRSTIEEQARLARER